MNNHVNFPEVQSDAVETPNDVAIIGDIEWGGLARGNYVKSAMFERGGSYKIKTEELLFKHAELSKRCALCSHTTFESS